MKLTPQEASCKIGDSKCSSDSKCDSNTEETMHHGIIGSVGLVTNQGYMICGSN
jgi:hypothetical protein